jgi:hypothetical protein
MDYKIHSYRFASEIVEHPNHNTGFDNIKKIISKCPLYICPKKSRKNQRLDVVQQLLNTYFVRQFVCELGWAYHSDATCISNLSLKAEFRTQFNGLRVQTEVQLGSALLDTFRMIYSRPRCIPGRRSRGERCPERQSATEAKNYILTTDLKLFRSLNQRAPQTAYNWLTAELISYIVLALRRSNT